LGILFDSEFEDEVYVWFALSGEDEGNEECFKYREDGRDGDEKCADELM
jgi:hypothetical protein